MSNQDSDRGYRQPLWLSEPPIAHECKSYEEKSRDKNQNAARRSASMARRIRHALDRVLTLKSRYGLLG